MAEDFNMEANISADVRAFLRAMDDAIDANRRFGDSTDANSTKINAMERRLVNAKKAFTETAGATEANTKAAVTNATATEAQARANRDLEGNLIRTRYALYDVATTYAAVSAATLGAVTATSLFAARYETAFTEIERTTLDSAGRSSAGLANLREQFLDLSEVLPLTFQELTKIGSLGAQLGIAEGDLVSFTDTVAKFSRLSGISAEESALAFGRIGELLNVLPEDYDKLGSSIAFVATQSAATEAQLISVTKEIAAAASGAGFTAAEVVGLAGSLASLGVAPEKSRGSLELFFGTLNLAVAEGGTKLADFASVVGVTSGQLKEMVENGQGEDVLRGFIEGLNDLNNVQVTQALDRLNLSQLRVTDTFKRLSQNLNRVETDMTNAQNAFEQGVFLDQAFAVVLDDVASQFQLLLNSIGRFLATAGQPFLEFLRTALPVMASFFTELSNFASGDYGPTVFGLVGALTALVGVMAAVRAASALATASLLAMRTAQLALAGEGIIGGLRGVALQMLGIDAAAKKTTASVALLTAGFKALLRATIVLGLLAGAFDLVANEGKGLTDFFTGAAATAIQIFGGAADALYKNLGDLVEILKVIPQDAEELRQLNPIFGGIADSVNGLIGPLVNAINFLRLFVSEGNRAGAIKLLSGKGFARTSRSKNASEVTNPYATATDGAEDYANALDGVGGSAGGAAKQVRTLVDYASDLSSVFGRAFDIRFGSQLAIDQAANSWDSLGERIRDARIELQQLTADKRVKEYFLSVANAYGDELRAGVLRGEIAEINDKMAQTQADASTELNGSSQAARQNRQVLTGLISDYQEYITALAASGADQATLNAAVARSKIEFMNQAQALGFSNEQLQPYIASFGDMTKVINNVPRNITVTANVDPALQALNEFVAAARTAGATAGGAFSSAYSEALKKQARGTAILASIQAALAIASNPSEPASRRVQYSDRARALSDLYNSGSYYTGGYTGAGGKYEPAGIVHKGEYVVPKSQVNQSTGLPKPGFMGATGSQLPSSRGASYAGGGFVSGAGANGSLMVELSPYDRNLLKQVGNVQLRLDGQVVASTANRVNTLNAQRGTA